MIQKLGIDSLRAEITWFEAARAYTAASGRIAVKLADLHAVAPMALRLRRSNFMEQYFSEQKTEEDELKSLIKPFKRKSLQGSPGKGMGRFFRSSGWKTGAGLCALLDQGFRGQFNYTALGKA